MQICTSSQSYDFSAFFFNTSKEIQICTSALTHLFSANSLLKSKSLLWFKPWFFFTFPLQTKANPNLYFVKTPWFFFLFSYVLIYDFKSLFRLTPIYFLLICYWNLNLYLGMISLPFSFIKHKQIQICTLSWPHDFSSSLHHMISNLYFSSHPSFSAKSLLKSKPLLWHISMIFLLFYFISSIFLLLS